MNDFLRFVEDLLKRFPMHVEITYSKICDWQIYIYKKGCAEDYPDCPHDEEGNAIIVCEQDLDMELCFAKAHVALKEWLCNYEGGY